MPTPVSLLSAVMAAATTLASATVPPATTTSPGAFSVIKYREHNLVGTGLSAVTWTVHLRGGPHTRSLPIHLTTLAIEPTATGIQKREQFSAQARFEASTSSDPASLHPTAVWVHPTMLVQGPSRPAPTRPTNSTALPAPSRSRSWSWVNCLRNLLPNDSSSVHGSTGTQTRQQPTQQTTQATTGRVHPPLLVQTPDRATPTQATTPTAAPPTVPRQNHLRAILPLQPSSHEPTGAQNRPPPAQETVHATPPRSPSPPCAHPPLLIQAPSRPAPTNSTAPPARHWANCLRALRQLPRISGQNPPTPRAEPLRNTAPEVDVPVDVLVVAFWLAMLAMVLLVRFAAWMAAPVGETGRGMRMRRMRRGEGEEMGGYEGEGGGGGVWEFWDPDGVMLEAEREPWMEKHGRRSIDGEA